MFVILSCVWVSVVFQQGWKRHGFYCYRLGNVFATFAEANETCQKDGAHLAAVDDR